MEHSQDLKVTATHRLMADYYPDFQCIAERCQDSCCGGWDIALSKKDYLALCSLPGKGGLEDKLGGRSIRVRGAESSEKKYAVLSLQEGKCLLLNEEGLCSLQLAHGHENLPKVCREFPRGIAYTAGGNKEFYCSTGCEAVLYALYQRQEGLGFIMEELPKAEQLIMMYPNARYGMVHFDAIRELGIDLLQDRSMSLPLRLLALGWVLRDLEQREQAGEAWDIPQWIEQRRQLLAAAELRQELERLEGNQNLFIANHVKQLLFRPMMAGAMAKLRDDVFLSLGVAGQMVQNQLGVEFENYAIAEKAFLENYGDLEYFFENIMVNIFFGQKHPFCNDAAGIWENYIALCNNYSTLKFLAVCGCAGHSDLERLFHVLTQGSRMLLHNASMQQFNTHELLGHGNGTLADMAILVRG